MSWPSGLPEPLTIEQQAIGMATLLDQWAKPRGAQVVIVQGQGHLWENIYSADDTPRLLICFSGEVLRGAEIVGDRDHRVDRNWKVVVVRGHGFGSANLMPQEGGEQPTESFLVTAESVRDAARVMLGLSEEFPLHYKGMTPVPNLMRPGSANVFVDAYEISFSTANDIPQVVLTAGG